MRHSYDASGRQTQTTQTTSRPNPNPHINTTITTAVTIADTYDGDGLGVRRDRIKGLNSPMTTTTYYLRSTVLGGRIVAEYNSTGARQSSNVWAGGDVLAQQTGVDIGAPALRWEHLNPATGDGRETDSSGRAVKATHLDPAGVDVGESDPFAGAAGDPSAGTSDSSIQGKVAQLMSGYFDMKCSLDGMLTGCAVAEGAVGSGAAEQCPDNDCGPRDAKVIITYESGRRDVYTGQTDPLKATANESGFGVGGMLLPDNYSLTLKGADAVDAAKAFGDGMLTPGGFSYGLSLVLAAYGPGSGTVNVEQRRRRKQQAPAPQISDKCKKGLMGANMYTKDLVVVTRARARTDELQQIADGSGVDWKILGAIAIRETGVLSRVQPNGKGRAFFQVDLGSFPEAKGIENWSFVDQGRFALEKKLLPSINTYKGYGYSDELSLVGAIHDYNSYSQYRHVRHQRKDARTVTHSTWEISMTR